MKEVRFIKMALSVAATGFALMLNAQNVPAEKANLVANGNFEDGVASWAGPGEGDSVEFKDGKGSLKLDNKGKPVFMYNEQNIMEKLKPSTEYILSWDCKRSNAGKGKVLAAVLEKAEKSDTEWTTEHPGKLQEQAGKWEHFELRFTTGAEIADAIIILYNINTMGTVWFDNVSVVEAK